jgi:hypothetical protein
MKTLLNFLLVLSTVLGGATMALATDRLRVDEIVGTDGGSPVSFPGGFTSPTGGTGDIYASTASLTLAAGTNVAAVVTPVTLKFHRIGNEVCAFGQVSIDPTSGATASTFTLTLPVTRASNFSGTGGANGGAGILGGAVGSCLATNGAKTVTCNYVSGGTAVELVPVRFCYVVSGD